MVDEVVIYLILIFTGLIAGFINTLAGGGSMLTLPALMMSGMPADVANATNRVGVLLQSLEGVRGFRAHKQLDHSAIVPVMIPTVLGALLGALLASYLPVTVLKPTLLGCMILIALITLIKPNVIAPPADSIPYRLAERPGAAAGLFLAGVYGGFVQAGVGFMLITALAGGLRYNLVRTHALKLVCTSIFSCVALGVFLVRGQVLWLPGLVLAAGMVVGTSLSVRFAISASQSTLKWLLFTMVLLTCGGAFYVD